jgi:two-component system OmpR family sensor kinase
MLWLLENVIGNAVKHTPKNGRIVITMRSEDKQGVIEVTNTAAPLPETELQSIFEPFQRGSNQTGQGSGLGLALVARIAENVGGTVQATNAATGFRLTVRVPSSTTA